MRTAYWAKLTETGPSQNCDVIQMSFIIVVTLPGSKTQAWSSRGRRCQCIACNFWGGKTISCVSAQNKSRYLSSERRNSSSLRTVSMPSKASMLSLSWVGGFRGVRKVWRKWGEGTRETSRKAAELRTWQSVIIVTMMTMMLVMERKADDIKDKEEG